MNATYQETPFFDLLSPSHVPFISNCNFDGNSSYNSESERARSSSRTPKKKETEERTSQSFGNFHKVTLWKMPTTFLEKYTRLERSACCCFLTSNHFSEYLATVCCNLVKSTLLSIWMLVSPTKHNYQQVAVILLFSPYALTWKRDSLFACLEFYASSSSLTL